VGFQGPVLELSNRGGEGFDGWLDWLHGEIQAQRERAARGERLRPNVQPEGAALHGSPDGSR
jgi:hydrogenase nickel incorporation protein HypB